MIKVTGNRLFHWFDTIKNAGVKNNKCITSVEKFKKNVLKCNKNVHHLSTLYYFHCFLYCNFTMLHCRYVLNNAANEAKYH